MNLKRMAPRNVTFTGAVSDAQLAWLYAQSTGIVAASYEDYGLTPLEAAAFGKPSLVLRWGGFVDTVIEEETGIFFESPTPAHIREAVQRLRGRKFHQDAIRAHASRYSEDAFIGRLRAIVATEMQTERLSLGPAQKAMAGLA
jgi:glycosyltransferase involved in cell wall biosynthesis